MARQYTYAHEDEAGIVHIEASLADKEQRLVTPAKLDEEGNVVEGAIYEACPLPDGYIRVQPSKLKCRSDQGVFRTQQACTGLGDQGVVTPLVIGNQVVVDKEVAPMWAISLMP